jgi:RNA polymerase sigma-70 factor (ECF subfamily)
LEWEAEIAVRCSNNDRRAQEELFKHYSAPMLGICSRYARNKDEAKDILHDGFIKIFTHISTFKGNCSLKTWMTVIFINTAITHVKKDRKFSYYEGDELESHLDHADHVDQETDVNLLEDIPVDEVLDFVQKLPEKYRVIINMYSIDGYSHKEIASVLNISEGTSKSQLSRARKMLMALIRDKKKVYEQV